MIVPGRLTLLIAGALAMLLIAAVIEHAIVVAVLAGDLLLIGICFYEGRTLARAPIDVEREDWPRVQVGRSERWPTALPTVRRAR